MTLLWIAIAAFAAGAINAVAGGGTFLTFPALTGFAQLSEKVANMTSTIGLWPGSATALLPARAEIQRVPRGMLIAYCLISLVGGVGGALLLSYTTERSFRLLVPWLLAFATVIFAFSKPIARWAGRGHGERSLKWTIFVGIIQLAVAIYGGYFGAGMGVLMLAGLSFAGLDDIYQLTALKVLMATLINGVAAIIFLFGQVDWRMALLMAIASSFGGFLGMAYARRIPQNYLRLLILAIGVILTVVYFYKAYA